MKWLENWIRGIIRSELQAFMESPEKAPNSYSIKSAAGGEIIMPNFVREQFDSGNVTSIKDII